MIDLEKLIRDRQDELRGRPEDRIDRFMGWWRGWNWWDAMFWTAVIAFFAIMVVLR